MSWKEVALSELFDVCSSKRVLKSQWQAHGVPFYRGREVTKLAKHGAVENELFISEELYADFERKYGVPKAGDIVITAIGTIGNSYIVRPEDRFYFKDASVLWLSKKSEAESSFVDYWLQSSNFRIQLDKANGATVDTLTIGKLKSVRIAIPLRPEQKRVVAILDEAFAGLETALANTEKNLANAREIFESELEKIAQDAAARFDVVPLMELATDITDGDHMPPPKAPDGLPFITIKNIDKASREIDFSDTFRVPKAYYDSLKSNRRPQKGDVLYTVTGSYGIPVLVETDQKFCFQRHIGLIRPRDNVSGRWLEYMLLSRPCVSQADEGATGTAQKTISLKVLRAMKLPNSSPEEQQRAVARLDDIRAQTNRLSSVFGEKLEALHELKQSLLQKAFSGELTADRVEEELEPATV